MSAWPIVNALAGAGLVVRWTALLALAWLGHGALSGRNPRWRVALWRAAMVGVAGVGVLTLAPPVLTVPVVPAATAVVVPTAVAPSMPQFRPPGPDNRPAATSVQRQDSSLPAPATAVPASAAAWRIMPALLGLWAIGGAVLTARLVLAWFGLGRIIGRSDEAPERVVGQCLDVAKAIGAPAVRVVCSAEMATPCLAGLRRPVLLLPARAMADDDLRAVFAHELAHARGHDLAWNLVAHFATIVLWFHPLAWRLRSAHAAACDAVCDAVAADFLGDVPTYARTLARLALVALEPPPEPALAMARSTDICRRVDALNRKVFRSPLPRRLTMPAVLGWGVLLMLIGGLAVTDAGPLASTKAAAHAASAEASDGPPEVSAADNRLEIQAVVAATGKPLEGATVDWSLQINRGRSKKTTSMTDSGGRAVLEWPKGATVTWVEVKARKAGFAPYLLFWDGTANLLRFPAVKELRFVPGTTIGGMVKDEAGNPVAEAKIRVHAPPTESEASPYHLNVAETTTDPQGRWRIDDAPANLGGMSVAIQAPRFLESSGLPSRDLDAVTVLKRGFTVKGRVLDTQGKPVVGGNASYADQWRTEPKAKTDAQGEFVLENCPPGASLITVQAKGFAPDLQEIHTEDQPTLEFRLGPGHTVRGKIVDRQGKPVAGATVATDTWRTHRSLSFRVDTDRDGRFEWRDAPGDTILYSLFKAGYMARRLIALPPSDAEQTLTLDPELVITGRVTDAATGRPVPAFRAVQGLVFSNNPRISWQEQAANEFTDGRFTIKHSEPYAGYAVRIEAPGYKPADSRVFKLDEVAPSFDVALALTAPTDLLTGTVVRPDGQPAAEAEVVLATRDHPLLFESEQVRFSRMNGMLFAKTGPDGRFTFNAPPGPFLLAAMSDDGYAESRVKSGTLALQGWGKVKGQAFIGRQPAANQTISISLQNDQSGQNGINTFYNINTLTDAQGRFAFNRVRPGASIVSRVVVTTFGNGSSQNMGCWQEPVNVVPGQTMEVRIGGKGRAVIGRVALQAAPGVHVDWRQNQPVTVERARAFMPLLNLFGPDPHQNDRFASSLDKEGRFRVDDVPPGRYELTVTIDAPPASNRPGPGNELGRVKVPVDVPEGDDDSPPIDLGEIKAEVNGKGR